MGNGGRKPCLISPNPCPYKRKTVNAILAFTVLRDMTLFLCDVFSSAVCSVLLQILKDEMLGDGKEAVVSLVV